MGLSIDREKVINDLQDAVNDDWMWQHADYYALTMERAIALLKEQEAKEQCLKTKCIICPHCNNCDVDENGLLKEQEAKQVKLYKLHGKEEWIGLVCVCPDCKVGWMGSKSETHFCPNCGKKVTWE